MSDHPQPLDELQEQIKRLRDEVKAYKRQLRESRHAASGATATTAAPFLERAQQLALDQGSRDNVSCIVIEVVG